MKWCGQMNNIKKKIQSAEYEFLRSDPDLSNIIYLTVSGSRAYGTNIEGSDIDLRGVLVETPQYIYGLDTFEQFEETETDTVIFGLKKYVSLCVNGNPNALEFLGTREEDIIYNTTAGSLLREQAGIFLSRRVIQSFGNYASAQLRRLANALCRGYYDEAEQEKHLASTFMGQMDHFNRMYTPIEEGAMQVYLSDEEEPRLLFDVNLKGYPLREFGGIYSEMSNVIKSYGRMNHRNRKKDEKRLYKHGLHLIRLLVTGEDILKGKGIITYRAKEHDLFMDIRQGKLSFKEVIKLAESYQKRFDEAAEKTKLPEEPDMGKVLGMMERIYGGYY